MKKFIALAVVLTVAMLSPVNWGLSHKGGGQTPTAPAEGVALLNKYNGVYYSKNTVEAGEKKVFFTFDLGYESGYTAEVLDILRENNIHGIFFLTGHYLKQQELINRMIDEGHMIGNHTDKHKDLPTLSDEKIAGDIMDFQNAFTSQYPNAKPPVFFRPPQGRLDEKTLRIASDNGLRAMMWSSAIVDWNKKPIDPEKSADKIISRIHPGAIMLFHIANSGTPEMLKLLITQLTENGYAIGSPDEI